MNSYWKFAAYTSDYAFKLDERLIVSILIYIAIQAGKQYWVNNMQYKLLHKFKYGGCGVNHVLWEIQVTWSDDTDKAVCVRCGIPCYWKRSYSLKWVECLLRNTKLWFRLVGLSSCVWVCNCKWIILFLDQFH